MKKCCTCKLEKELSEFGNDKTSTDGHFRRCLICARAIASKWYKANRKLAISRVKANVDKIRDWLQELKSTMKCSKCPENHTACLDFHHRDPSKKSFNIGRSFRSGSRNRILKEIAKCDILCANCHRKFHYPSVAQQ